MPLRDHFRYPIVNYSSWEGFHGMWPGEMIHCLLPHLPENYTAEPRVHLGRSYELDVNAYEHDESSPRDWTPDAGAEEPATLVAPAPTLILEEADLKDEYEYEVLIFDQNRTRQLVAAVEIASPGNQDRPESRRAFVTKCAALLKKGVSVSIVDLVTDKHFNLYTDLLDFIGRADPSFTPPPDTYAVTCRARKREWTTSLDLWAYRLTVGEMLPTLPIWLEEERMIPLDLEASYETTCRALRIR